jgi:hypothetical protein
MFKIFKKSLEKIKSKIQDEILERSIKKKFISKKKIQENIENEKKKSKNMMGKKGRSLIVGGRRHSRMLKFQENNEKTINEKISYPQEKKSKGNKTFEKKEIKKKKKEKEKIFTKEEMSKLYKDFSKELNSSIDKNDFIESEKLFKKSNELGLHLSMEQYIKLIKLLSENNKLKQGKV